MPVECKFICEVCATEAIVANPIFMPQDWTAFGPVENVTEWTDKTTGHLFACSEKCYQAIMAQRGMTIVGSNGEE